MKLLKNRHALLGGLSAFIFAVIATLYIFLIPESAQFVIHPYAFAVSIFLAPIFAYWWIPKEEEIFWTAETHFGISIIDGTIIGFAVYFLTFALQGLL